MTRRLLFILLLVLGTAKSAFAAKYEVCVKLDVWAPDQGAANGIEADYWADAGDLDGYRVTGRGFRVKLSQPGWSQVYDSDPTTGCFTVDRPTASGFTVRVYGYSTNKDGNVVRIHPMGLEDDDWYPNPSLSQVWGNQTLSSTQPNDYVLDGLGDDRFTTIAAAAFGLYRYPEGSKDTVISIGFDDGKCGSSSSIFGKSEKYVESNRAHLIVIGRCPGFGSDARERMIVTHEMGHARMRLYYGKDGDEQPRNDDYSPPVPPTAPISGTDCVNVTSYDMTSLEWNSQPFKESFADFWSARVWNKKEYRGTYIYRMRPYDLETWDVWNDTSESGGFTSNVCSYGGVSGVSTKGDWVRFLWDWYTTHSCGDQPTKLDVMKVYRAVRQNHLDGTFVLSNSTYDQAVIYAIEETVGDLTQCQRDIAQPYADFNGI